MSTPSVFHSSNSIFQDQIFRSEKVDFSPRDPLVLSCAAKRLQQQQGGFISLENTKLLKNITDEDTILANTIKDYYTKKFFLRQFTSKLSPYRTRLCYLLEHQIQICDEKDVGIYYKLPYFYEEDQVYNDLKQLAVTNYKEYDDRPKTNQKTVLELEYIKRSFAYQRKTRLERFWFTNSNKLYCIEIMSNNPLIDFFNDQINKNTPITLETYITVDNIDGMYFYKLFNFTMRDKHA